MKVRLLNDDDRLGYFAWALETWSLTSPVSRLLASPAAASVDDAVHWINRAVESELYPGEELLSPYAFRRQFGESLAEAELYPGWRPLRYTEFIGIPPTFILAQGDRHFAADDSPNAPVVLQEAAYQLMLASFLGAFGGMDEALRWLGVLMVRGSLNRQLAIVRFLNLVTGGRVGLTAEALSSRGEEAPLPSRSEVIEWARAMLSEDVQVESVLPEMVRAYIERSRSPRGE